MELERRWLLIAALPVLAYMGTDELFYSLANPAPPSPAMDLTVSPSFEAARRIRFLAALAVYLALALLTVGLFLGELFRPGRYSARTRRDVIVTFSAGVVVALLYGLSTVDERFYAYLARDLYEAVMRVCAPPGQLEAPCLFGTGRLDRMPTGFDFTLRLGAVAAIISIMAMALGAILALAGPEHRDPAKAPQDVAEEAFRLPRLFLYVSSACFTMAMVALLSWVNIVVPYLDGDPAKAAFAAMRDAGTVYYGVAYSLMILSAYVPVVLAITLRLRQAGIQGEAGGAIVSRQSSIKEALALMAPILTALISAAGADIFGKVATAAL